jgi:hypothetical protein
MASVGVGMAGGRGLVPAAMFLLVLAGMLGLVPGAVAGRAVDVQIRSEAGATLPAYPVSARPGAVKAYVEAVKGDHYTIVVRNLLDRRVGVVVAVDGRNIVSGKQSWLRNDERMYILEPYATGEFNGWRTSLAAVNRFYFTDAGDSYAAAFRDESAMGVIAVAVYPEVRRPEPFQDLSRGQRSEQRAAPSAKAEADSAGTGFGRAEPSPARVVAFAPEATAAERVYLKYEWRESLCRQAILRCAAPVPPRNRLWGDEGFAPPPPGRS